MSNTGLALNAEIARAARRRRLRKQATFGVRVFYVVLALAGAFLMAFPLFWMVSTALKLPGDVFATPPVLFPLPPQWHNFQDGFTAPALPDNFLKYVWNTTWYTVLEVIGDTLVGAVVAFGFARLRAPGSTALFFLVLATIMIPFQATPHIY